MKDGTHESNVAKLREKMAYFVSDVGLGCFSRVQLERNSKGTCALTNNSEENRKAMLLLVLGSALTSNGPGQPKMQRTSLDLSENCALFRRKQRNLICTADSLVLPHLLPPKMLNELEGRGLTRVFSSMWPRVLQLLKMCLPLLAGLQLHQPSFCLSNPTPSSSQQPCTCYSHRQERSAPSGLHGWHLFVQVLA